MHHFSSKFNIVMSLFFFVKTPFDYSSTKFCCLDISHSNSVWKIILTAICSRYSSGKSEYRETTEEAVALE